ncbi:hypothetical protein ACIBI3_19885 [Actinomadura luteofluorescens]|uniref:hypothetical protein n=1 Tax=Actinomadura luteofluorescens TaxID=46163 RepID=UPI00347D6C98
MGPWNQVENERGVRGMADDVYPHLLWGQGRHAFYVSVRDDEAELRGCWDDLADGAIVLQPLGSSQWASPMDSSPAASA